MARGNRANRVMVKMTNAKREEALMEQYGIVALYGQGRAREAIKERWYQGIGIILPCPVCGNKIDHLYVRFNYPERNLTAFFQHYFTTKPKIRQCDMLFPEEPHALREELDNQEAIIKTLKILRDTDKAVAE